MNKSELWERIFYLTFDPWNTEDDEKKAYGERFMKDIERGYIDPYLETLIDHMENVCMPNDGREDYDFDEMKNYVDLIVELKKHRKDPVSRIEIETGREEGTYYFRKHNGIRYDVYEGTSIAQRGSQTFTSDAFFVMLDSYEDIPCEFVGWMFGATDFDRPASWDYLIRELDVMTDDWEKNHADIVKRIIDGEVEEMKGE